MVLLAPARAAKMTMVEYKAATRALIDGAERVDGAGGKYFWHATAAMATPAAAGESWYLHSGSERLPIGLQALIKKPDGTPATRSPDSAAVLGYTGSGGVTWPNHAYNHLVFPRLWALLPPTCKRAVVWNPESAKLDGVSVPPKCSAAAPGYGYMDVPAGTSTEALQRRPNNPLLILLEAKCLAGRPQSTLKNFSRFLGGDILRYQATINRLTRRVAPAPEARGRGAVNLAVKYKRYNN